MAIPREHRLRRHAEFELVYRNGRRHFSPMLTAFYLLRNPADVNHTIAENQSTQAGRVGITVGRALGKAATRNRIKRRVREAVGQNLGKLTRPVDVVINPKKIVLEAEFSELLSEISKAFVVIDQKALPGAYQDRAGAKSDTMQPQRHAARKT